MASQKAVTPSAPKGFAEGDSFQYDGKIESVPDWVDKGWATYDRGPALAVPVGDPWGQPYTTNTARIGDFVFANKDKDRFIVVRAEEFGEQPGDPELEPTWENPQPAKPAGAAEASLEDLEKQDLPPYEDMTEEQQAQLRQRGTLPGRIRKQERDEAAAQAASAPRGSTRESAPSRSTTTVAAKKTTTSSSNE